MAAAGGGSDSQEYFRESQPEVSDDEQVESDDGSGDADQVIEKNCSERTRGVCWCFTHFLHEANGKECDQFPCECCDLKIRKTYKVIGGGFGLETCPKTKRQHHQGWMMMDQEIPFEQLKKLFCHKVHWAKMAGTVAQNIKYCSKEEQYTGFGVQDKENPHLRAGKGQRNDLAAVAAASESGATVLEIAKKHPVEFMKYHRGIIAHNELVKPEFEEQPRQFIVLWGETGSGKSWGAQHFINGESFYRPESNQASHLSFEGYDGQKWILIEEFKGLGLFCDDLKQLTDRFGVTMRGRGSSKKGRHLGVIITSQCDPMSWYPSASEEDMSALLRRMTRLYQCNRDKWLNQLTGVVRDNPCPFISQAAPIRTLASLPRLPSATSSSVSNSTNFLLNNKKRKFGKVFPKDPKGDQEEIIDLR